MIAGILQAIFEVVLLAIFEPICYFAGRVVVPIVSCGSLKCDGFVGSKPQWKMSRQGLYQRRGKQLWLTSDGTTLVGFFTLLVTVAIVLWLAFGSK